MICKNCGFENENGNKFCQGCGQPLKKSPALKIIIIAAVCVAVAVGAVAAVMMLNADDDTAGGKTAAADGERERSMTTAGPEFSDVYASSVRESQYGNDYGALNVIDGDIATAWVEGISGYGEGELLEFVSGEMQHVSGVMIVNGYDKDEDLYVKNSRVKEIEAIFDDGSSERLILEDEYGIYQDLEFEHPVDTTSVKLKILSVYSGTEYDDTCISEVEFY